MPIVERGPREVGELTISPDGKWAVIRREDGTATLWDVESAAVARALAPQRQALRAVAMTADGRLLATRTERRNSHIVDLLSETVVCGLAEETRLNHSAAFNAGGTRLIGSSMGYGDEPLGVWDARSGASLLSESEHPGAVAISSCGRFAVGSLQPDKIRVWDLESRGAARELRGHDKPVTSLAITARGEWLASASVDKSVRLWHALRWDSVELFEGHEAGVTTVAITPGGRLVLSGARDHSLRLWLRGQKTPLAIFDLGQPVAQCGISADGHSLIAQTPSGDIRFLKWE